MGNSRTHGTRFTSKWDKNAGNQAQHLQAMHAAMEVRPADAGRGSEQDTLEGQQPTPEGRNFPAPDNLDTAYPVPLIGAPGVVTVTRMTGPGFAGTS